MNRQSDAIDGSGSGCSNCISQVIKVKYGNETAASHAGQKYILLWGTFSSERTPSLRFLLCLLRMDASLVNVFVSELVKFKTGEQFVNVSELQKQQQQQVNTVDESSLPKLTDDELTQLQDQMRKVILNLSCCHCWSNVSSILITVLFASCTIISNFINLHVLKYHVCCTECTYIFAHIFVVMMMMMMITVTIFGFSVHKLFWNYFTLYDIRLVEECSNIKWKWWCPDMIWYDLFANKTQKHPETYKKNTHSRCDKAEKQH